MSKHIELAKKLKALADKGIGGEKINADKMLNDLMKKHNLTIEDIEGEKTADYFFKFKDDDTVRLWGQIVARVNYKIPKYGEIPAKKVKQLNLKGNYFVTCTVAEYMEIESMLGVYPRLYKQELDIFYSAFCKANDLLVTEGKPKTTDDLTPKEYEEWKRVQEMASKIKSETFRKQLN